MIFKCSIFLLNLSLFPFGAFSKPCSGYKMKEMSGNGIFSDNADDSASEPGSVNSNNRTSIRTYQVYFTNLLDFETLYEHF